MRAPVPARPTQPGIPGWGGGGLGARALPAPGPTALRWGRGLSPGPPRAGVGSGGGAARRPDRGRAAAASPLPAAAAAATRDSATSAPPTPRPATPHLTELGGSRAKHGREQRLRGTEGGAGWAAGETLGAGARLGGGGGRTIEEKMTCFCPGGSLNCRPPPRLTSPVHSGQTRIPKDPYPIRFSGYGDAAASGTLGIYKALFIYEVIYSTHKHYI